MKTKVCFKCSKRKRLESFYRHPQMKDGSLNKCKSCAREDVRSNRRDRRDYYIGYDRERYTHSPERRAACSAASKRSAERNPERRAAANEKYRRAHLDKVRAHSAVGRAVRSGKLRKPKRCSECGRSGLVLHAHHTDYTRPLDVIWLCAEDHNKLHRKERNTCTSRPIR